MPANRPTIAFTSGCFDNGLHAGHLHLFEVMRSLADHVFVALNDDSYILRKKHREPILALTHRRKSLWATNLVDMVEVFEEDGPLNLIMSVKPDFIVVGDDYTLDQVVGGKECAQWGGRVVLVPRLAGFSTSAQIAMGACFQ